MREFIGVEVLANTVSMLISTSEGAIWISDCDQEAFFYEARCAHPKAIVIPAANQAHTVITMLKERGIIGVVATVPLSAAKPTDNEFSLSCGDVTSLLVFSSSCLRILEEIAGRIWYTAADNLTGGFRARAIRIARGLALMREALGVTAKDRARSLSLLQSIVNWSILDFDRRSISLDSQVRCGRP